VVHVVHVSTVKPNTAPFVVPPSSVVCPSDDQINHRGIWMLLRSRS
jgi:hypothetical protein